MARDYAKTNLTIWDDPEWRALPWPAQHVYKMFWEHPGLSYCGVADWRPAKMTGWGGGWQREHLNMLTDCLRARHFLVVDEGTEECLVRSWVRFDGVIRQPRLAVSMAKAYSEVGSSMLRGVIISELVKLREREPDAAGWAKPQPNEMLRLPQVEAKSIPVPEDPFGSGFGIALGSVSEAFGPNAEQGFPSVSGSPTTAPSTSPSNNHPSAEPQASASADAERDEAFDTFWAAYPRKKEKRDGVKAYRSALRRTSPDRILEALGRDKRTTWAQRAPEFIPYPASWLNGDPWDDEPDEPVQPVRHLQRVEDIEEPPDGLNPAEYREWYIAQHSKRGGS